MLQKKKINKNRFNIIEKFNFFLITQVFILFKITNLSCYF